MALSLSAFFCGSFPATAATFVTPIGEQYVELLSRCMSDSSAPRWRSDVSDRGLPSACSLTLVKILRRHIHA